MNDGFLKVAAGTPKIKVADTTYNGEKICELIDEAVAISAKLLVLPELCITGYTCGDLFIQQLLLESAKKELKKIRDYTKDKNILVVVGLPLDFKDAIYNVVAVMFDGKILGIVPKTNIPNYSEFYEARYFRVGFGKAVLISLLGEEIPFGTDILFQCTNIEGFVLAAEICEDLWVPAPPSVRHAQAGASIIVNSSASNEIAGKDEYRRSLLSAQSARLVCGYVYADAGEGESTTDLVFGSHNLIAENGKILAESKRFKNEMVVTDIDLGRIFSERRKLVNFSSCKSEEYYIVKFEMKNVEEKLSRTFYPHPFIPSNKEKREKRCEEILTIQALGLKQRLSHTASKNAVIGVSGGLDSTLALLVTIRAFDMLELPRSQIIAVTMPCFGTTDRTYENAITLTNRLKVTLREINIKEAVQLHFRDIGHDENTHDVTYENAQARERTQVLMDIANQNNGLVIGTGDMSELALGWATYNGDHMSMYGVNSSIPKTLIKYLILYYADSCQDESLKKGLLDILDTPVSPELLPPVDGIISQKTEDIVGPYELHDFFLYYTLRFAYPPKKVFRVAKLAFEGSYKEKEILKWLKIFYKRFFSQQFKRSCLPDGPKVGSVAVSPRGDLRMPSDASVNIWMKESDSIEIKE
ncbi:MAG: NAD(+) synthase [Clostridiales bacterium]|nr:NAD(+) synthase [Clostridiales bacterium]